MQWIVKWAFLVWWLSWGALANEACPNDCEPGYYGSRCTLCNCPTGMVCDDGNQGSGSCSYAKSCSAIKMLNLGSYDNAYWIDPDGSGGSIPPMQVYCDMTTDGGGWTLISVGNSTSQVGATIVNSPDFVINSSDRQYFHEDVLAAMANAGAQQVMVREVSGADYDADLVMVYLLDRGKNLIFGSAIYRNSTADGIQDMMWHIGGDRYALVSNNAAGNWWGVSAHSAAFDNPVVPSAAGFATDGNSHIKKLRCTDRTNFGRDMHLAGLVSNGDYKMDHANTHGGTTRCSHTGTGIGVKHWIRDVDFYLVLDSLPSCLHHRRSGKVISGYYPIDPDGDGPRPTIKAWCDMRTDGGGWMLISTQIPDGQALPEKNSVRYDNSENQRYGATILQALADRGTGYQVMVEETTGHDMELGLVMVYKMPNGVPLRFDGQDINLTNSSYEMLHADGSYYAIRNDAGDSGDWSGISTSGVAWTAMGSNAAANTRCVYRFDFDRPPTATLNNVEGNYKMLQTDSGSGNTEAGTTRCYSDTSDIGVNHWYRECDAALGVSCN